MLFENGPLSVLKMNSFSQKRPEFKVGSFSKVPQPQWKNLQENRGKVPQPQWKKLMKTGQGVSASMEDIDIYEI